MTMPGKRVQFDEETWQALDLLGRDSMKDFQELADEAFRDLLRKHDRPVGLQAALRRSAGISNVTAFPGKNADKTKDKAVRAPAPKTRKSPSRGK
jgi:hypothetical protein